MNDRAAERAHLLSGIELFVNAGDSEEEYRKMQTQIPEFWPMATRGPVGPEAVDRPIEWPHGGQFLFRAFRDYLRRLWRSDFYRNDGASLDSRYLEYLLGLETRYAVDPPHGLTDAELPDQAFRDGWMALRKQHGGVYCVPSAAVSPSWNDARIEYRSTRAFQRAVYELLRDSWRAKTCRKCHKYFIADKPAQSHCSIMCSNMAKLESGVRYWREKGAARREARVGKRDKHVRVSTGSRSGKLPRKER